MKVLLYYEISHFGDGLYMASSYGLIKNHLFDFLGNALSRADGVEIKTLVSEGAYNETLRTRELDSINPIPIGDEEFLAISPRGTTFHEQYLKVFFTRFSDTEVTHYHNLIKSKLGQWEPDVIIAFPCQNEYLKRLFPRSLFLSNENGLFSRAPFPRTIRYEPLNIIETFTHKFAENIQAFKINSEQEDQIAQFRSGVIERIEKSNPFRIPLTELKMKYRHLVLLPIIWGKNVYKESFDNDEYAFLVNNLKEIPDDIGVIITKHDNLIDILNQSILARIKERHKNVITESDLGKRKNGGSPSLYFFNHVDAVLNCMTGTGLQACIWNTRIIALDKTYSHWFSDSIGLNNLEAKLTKPIRNRNSMLYWYLTHFIVWDKHFNDPNWIKDYISNRLKAFRNSGISFDFFDQIENLDELTPYVLRTIDRTYARSKVFDIVPPPIMRIASKVKQQLKPR